jgi:O-antigen ligase
MEPNLYYARLFMQKIAFPRYNRTLILLAVTIGSGLLLGIASPWFSPVWTLGLLAILAFGFAIANRPELGLLGYLIITSTIIDGSLLPRLSIGVGRLLITDIILLALLGLIIIRALLVNGFRIVHTPLDIPLIGFLGIVFLSTFIAIIQSRVTFNDSLGEVRVIMSYLTFFVVTNQVREKRQLRDLLRGLFLLATVVALGMIVQYLLGNNVQILPGRVETLDTEHVSFMGVTRVIPPGESLVFVTFVTMTVILVADKLRLKNIWLILMWCLTGLALILTFKRNLWIAVFIALFLLAILSWWRVRLRMLAGILLAISMVAIITSPILNQPGSEINKLVNGSLERLTSLANTQSFEDPNSSLRWRDFEYQYAIPQIASHPLIGLGSGAMYRPFVVGKDYIGFDGRTYIHNGHLSIIVKSGILGYLTFFVFSLVALLRGIKFWRRIPNSQLQAILLGFTLAYLGILIGSIVSPMVVTGWWTPVIGILLGINEVIIKKEMGVPVT